MYKSIGTIAIEPDGDAGDVKVIFDPVHDYSIKHGGNKYAVFVQDHQELITKPMDGVANTIKLKGINKIKEFNDMKKVLDQIVLHAQVRAAATIRSKVQVWVELDKNNLKLTNIMPA